MNKKYITLQIQWHGLDLEQYQSQIKEEDKEHKIELKRKKEGLLYKYQGGAFLREHMDYYVYGFNNHYGAIVERSTGGLAQTESANEGLYLLTPIGLALKPGDIAELNFDYVAMVREDLNEEEENLIKGVCQDNFSQQMSDELDLEFERMNVEQIKEVLKRIRSLPARTPRKEISNRSINVNLWDLDSFEL